MDFKIPIWSDISEYGLRRVNIYILRLCYWSNNYYDFT
jgi:hypothetical protein